MRSEPTIDAEMIRRRQDPDYHYEQEADLIARAEELLLREAWNGLPFYVSDLVEPWNSIPLGAANAQHERWLIDQLQYSAAGTIKSLRTNIPGPWDQPPPSQFDVGKFIARNAQYRRLAAAEGIHVNWPYGSTLGFAEVEVAGLKDERYLKLRLDGQSECVEESVTSALGYEGGHHSGVVLDCGDARSVTVSRIQSAVCHLADRAPHVAQSPEWNAEPQTFGVCVRGPRALASEVATAFNTALTLEYTRGSYGPSNTELRGQTKTRDVRLTQAAQTVRQAHSQLEASHGSCLRM